MTVIELHPEELLAKERSLVLTDVERSTLDAHLRDCAACRLLRQARSDFAAERAALDPGIEAGAVLAPRVIGELVRRARYDRVAYRTAIATTKGTTTRRHARRALRYVATAVLIGGSAAASSWAVEWYRERRSTTGPSVTTDHPATSSSIQYPRLGPSIAVPTAREAAAPSSVVSDEPVRSFPVEPALPTPASTTSHVANRAPLRQELEPVEPTTVRKSAERAPPTAADLFGQAMRARLAGKYEDALRSYRELERRHPTSAEARASRAMTARLLLDLGQPQAALADLGQYLGDHPAALAEEAMVSRALAYQRMGRGSDERRAWLELLRTYPQSLHAPRAKSRVDEIDVQARE